MKKSSVFIVFTFALSWLSAGIFYLLNQRFELSLTIFSMVYMFFPSLVAFLMQKFHKEPVSKPLLISFKLNKWFIPAILLPFFITIIALAFSLFIPDVKFSASYEGLFDRFSDKLTADQIMLLKEQLAAIPGYAYFFIMLLQAIVFGTTLNAVFAFGEELGWRGFMLRNLSHWTFAKVSVFTGFIWGIWHFPLILMGHNYPQHPFIGVGFMILFCILLSPIITYITIKSKSVVAAAIFHGNINAIAGLPIMYLIGGSDLTIGLTGMAGFVAIIFCTLLLFVFDKYVSKNPVFTEQIGLVLEDSYEETEVSKF